MKINKNLGTFNQVWDASVVNFSQGQVLEPIKIEQLIGNLFSLGDFYYYVIDFSSFPVLSLSFVDISTELFFGISKETLKFDDIVSNIHPDDIEFCLACEQVVMGFVANEIKPEDLPHYKFTFAFRIKNKLGEYRYIQRHSTAISISSDGKLTHSLNVHTDIGHITRAPTKVVSIIGFNGRPSYPSIDPLSPSFNSEEINILTKRELEIIKLISNGLQSDDIADRLNISRHTVKTHRKNLLRKLNAKNSAELIQRAKEMFLF
ncbi:MAG: DNA-binding CsgD family transcriptional regulator [Flavobacteriales bacterium]|jgi:DNA-binding CsgD family transcriptional regulator